MKNIPYPRFTLIYALLCLTVIAAGHYGLTWTYFLTKPAILIVLLIFFRVQTGYSTQVRFRNLMIAGFLFSAIGDLLLMFTSQSEHYFIGGLIAFLLAHLCYTAGFIFQIFVNRPWNQHWSQLAFSTMVVVYGAEFFILNRDNFGNLVVPVMIYCIAITAMGVAAVMRDRYKNRNGYFKVVTGVVFFIISDSFLATNKFIRAFEGADVWILGTYFLAQYLIAVGCLADLVKQPAPELTHV